MQILKHGNASSTKRKQFQCKSCGCIYTADKDEYFYDKSIFAYAYFLNAKYYANCPECYRMNSLEKGDHGYDDDCVVTVTGNTTRAP